jgi:peptide/nickel transport system ATP-binding protein
VVGNVNVSPSRALATEPRFIVCDEPVSALDVSVQAAIVNLLADLRDRFGYALFISHDLAVVAMVRPRRGDVSRADLQRHAVELLASPRHPYTRMLLAAVIEQSVDESQRDDAIADPGSGCAFAARCLHCLPSICETTPPSLRAVGASHEVACHLELVPEPGSHVELMSSIAPS